MGIAMSTNSSRLDTLREILARLRDETYERIASFRRDQSEEVMTSPGDEMDVARSTSDVETHASLIERSEDRLRLIDQALARVDNGTYGTCAECGEDIPIERLKALPFALLCVDCQQKRGRSRGRWGAGGTIEPYNQTWTPPADMEAEDRKPNSYGQMDNADSAVEDPFGPIDEGGSSLDAPKRRRGRPRKNRE
jgi:DnaK suppressor protein